MGGQASADTVSFDRNVFRYHAAPTTPVEISTEGLDGVGVRGSGPGFAAVVQGWITEVRGCTLTVDVPPIGGARESYRLFCPLDFSVPPPPPGGYPYRFVLSDRKDRVSLDEVHGPLGVIYGRAGADNVEHGDEVWGGGGNDTLEGAMLFGGPGDDTLTPFRFLGLTARFDRRVIRGGDGDDLLCGGGLAVRRSGTRPPQGDFRAQRADAGRGCRR